MSILTKLARMSQPHAQELQKLLAASTKGAPTVLSGSYCPHLPTVLTAALLKELCQMATRCQLHAAAALIPCMQPTLSRRTENQPHN